VPLKDTPLPLVRRCSPSSSMRILGKWASVPFILLAFFSLLSFFY
jgi:hypothetical protein